jgi:hypothetical protein
MKLMALIIKYSLEKGDLNILVVKVACVGYLSEDIRISTGLFLCLALVEPKQRLPPSFMADLWIVQTEI